MNRLELASMAAGSVLVVGGVAWIFPPAGLIVAGVLLFAVSWDSGASA